MFIEIFLFGVTVILSFILYKLLTIDRLYFEKRNLKYTPITFMWTNFINLLIGRDTVTEFVQKLYYTFPDEP